MPMPWDTILSRAIKDREIYNLMELSPDSIVLLRRSVGIELSTDKGRKWEWLGKNIFRVDEFTVDNKGIWWGLERWQGIHEPSYCRLYRSLNRGKTWLKYEFNTEVFFPYRIYSKPHEALSIININDKVFTLQGADPAQHWQFVKQLPPKNDLSDISAENYFISHSNNKLYIKKENGAIDTLVNFSGASDIYYIEKVKNVIYALGPAQDDYNNAYLAVYDIKSNLCKTFKVPGGDAKLIKTIFDRIYLTSTEGAFVFKNDNITPIFK